MNKKANGLTVLKFDFLSININQNKDKKFIINNEKLTCILRNKYI